jgi:hypothetical protein
MEQQAIAQNQQGRQVDPNFLLRAYKEAYENQNGEVMMLKAYISQLEAQLLQHQPPAQEDPVERLPEEA